MNYSNLQLLVQSPETQIPNHLKFNKALKLLEFSTMQAIETFESFYYKKKFHEFDPHVGETSCQIRAYQVLLLSAKIELEKFKIDKNIEFLKEILNKVRHDLKHYKEIEYETRARGTSSTTLATFIQENKYFFALDKDQLFLIYARILTIYKIFDQKGQPQIDRFRLSLDLQISKDTTRRLIHFYQKQLAEMSCEFILDISKQAMYSPQLLKTLKRLICRDDDFRPVMPCFFVMKAILSHMCHTNTDVLLIVKRYYQQYFFDTVLLPFSISERSNNFKFNAALYGSTTNKPCYIIQGITRYAHAPIETQTFFISRLLALGLEKLILLNEAAHPQFSGNNLKAFSTNPFLSLANESQKKEYEAFEADLLNMQFQANKLGCSINSQSLLYIEHIFCDGLNRQLHFDVSLHKSRAIFRTIKTKYLSANPLFSIDKEQPQLL